MTDQEETVTYAYYCTACGRRIKDDEGTNPEKMLTHMTEQSVVCIKSEHPFAENAKRKKVPQKPAESE